MCIYLGNQSRVTHDTYSRTDICMYEKKQCNFPMTWSNISIGKCMKLWDQEFPTKWCICKNWRNSTIVCRLNFTIKVFIWREYTYVKFVSKVFLDLSSIEGWLSFAMQSPPLVLHAGNHATRSVSWVSTLESSGAIQCYALSSDKSSVLHF